MKKIFATAAACALLAGTALAADTDTKSGQTATSPEAGKSTNSDGSRGTNESTPGTAINQTKNTGSDPNSAGKSTNSDGSTGATGESTGDGSGGSQMPDR
jgi:hypothetical protein